MLKLLVKARLSKFRISVVYNIIIKTCSVKSDTSIDAKLARMRFREPQVAATAWMTLVLLSTPMCALRPCPAPCLALIPKYH